MEISLLVDQKDVDGKWRKITEALFVFVARDPQNKGAALVNPLDGTNDAEKQYISEGEGQTDFKFLMCMWVDGSEIVMSSR